MTVHKNKHRGRVNWVNRKASWGAQNQRNNTVASSLGFLFSSFTSGLKQKMLAIWGYQLTVQKKVCSLKPKDQERYSLNRQNFQTMAALCQTNATGKKYGPILHPNKGQVENVDFHSRQAVRVVAKKAKWGAKTFVPTI